MLRVSAILPVVLIVTAFSACGRVAHRLHDPDLNVLLITIDTLRPDALGSYGNARAATPWMDRLAAPGVRFERATAHAAATLPSHASGLSGVYPPAPRPRGRTRHR